MHEIERFEHAGKVVRICRDEDPTSPREWGNLATLACWHRREKLGDEQIAPCSEDELRERLMNEGERVVAVLPLYLYQHSGMTMNTTGFSCPWDSGQVGWAYVTETAARRWRGFGTVTSQAWFEDAIRQEVSTYDEYLTGQVFGYEIETLDGDFIDSCWGFYGGLAYVREEARSAAEYAEDPHAAEKAEELASRATFAAGEGAYA